MFNILPDVDGAHVLDLFAGSGALGIEALSRGAAHATFVDAGKPALAAIRGEPRRARRSADRATVVAGDAVALAARRAGGAVASSCSSTRRTRATSRSARRRAAAAHLARRRARSSSSTIAATRLPRRSGSLLRTDQRRYGDTLVSFYRARARHDQVRLDRRLSRHVRPDHERPPRHPRARAAPVRPGDRHARDQRAQAAAVHGRRAHPVHPRRAAAAPATASSSRSSTACSSTSAASAARP